MDVVAFNIVVIAATLGVLWVVIYTAVKAAIRDARSGPKPPAKREPEQIQEQ